MNVDEIKNLDPFKSLLEGVTDMPEGASVEQQLQLLIQRLEIAGRMLGYANKLSDPADKKKHKSRIMTFLNQLNPMLNRLIRDLGYDPKQKPGQASNSL